MRTKEEIDKKIKEFEDRMLQIFSEQKDNCIMTTEEWRTLNQKVILLQWVKGIDIYETV